MTLGQLANKVAFYVQKTRGELVDAAGDDLVISALEHGRISLERDYDFYKQQVEVGLSVDPTTGGNLSSCVLMSGDNLGTTVVRPKTIRRMYLRGTNTAVWFPLLLDDKQLLAKKALEQNYKFRGYPSNTNYFQFRDTPLTRYGTDTRNSLVTRPFRGYYQGDILYIDPRPTSAQIVKLDVFAWMDPYVRSVTVLTSSTASATVTISATDANLVVGSNFLGRQVTVVATTTITLSGFANQTISVATGVTYWNENATDWLISEGSDYLMWFALCEVNMFTNTFVPRQNGFNAPPEKARDRALSSLILKDNYVWTNANEPLLIR